MADDIWCQPKENKWLLQARIGKFLYLIIHVLMLTLWRKDTEWCETGFPQYAGPVETHWHAAARSWLGMFLIQDYRGWKGQRRWLAYRGCWTMAPRSCSVASKSCSNSRMCYVILRTKCIRTKMGRIGNMMRCGVQIGGGICRCVDLSSCPPIKPISHDSVVTRLHGRCIWALEISKKRNAISQQLGQWYLWGTYWFANLNAFPRKSGQSKVTICFMSTCACCWNHRHSPYQRRWFQPWWEVPFGQSSLFCRCTSQITLSNSGCLLQRKCLSNMPGTKLSILSTPSRPTSHTATSFLAWRWTFSTNSIKGSSRIISWIRQLKRRVVEAMKWTRGFM